MTMNDHLIDLDFWKMLGAAWFHPVRPTDSNAVMEAIDAFYAKPGTSVSGTSSGEETGPGSAESDDFDDFDDADDEIFRRIKQRQGNRS